MFDFKTFSQGFFWICFMADGIEEHFWRGGGIVEGGRG
jgi:hypothetical protein